MSSVSDRAQNSVAPDSITVDAWLERLGQLATRESLLLSTVRERDVRDFELVLASAALFLPPGQLLDERTANQHLKRFLETAGRMLDTDHVELRRWLADLGFVHRSDYGTDYRRGAMPAWLAAAAEQLDADRLAGVALGARETHQRERAARKAAWIARSMHAQQAVAAIEVIEDVPPPAEHSVADGTFMRLAIDQAHNA